MTNPKVGYWYCDCCCADARQIETEEEVREIEEAIKERVEDGIEYIGIYATKEELVKQECSCAPDPCVYL